MSYTLIFALNRQCPRNKAPNNTSLQKVILLTHLLRRGDEKKKKRKCSGLAPALPLVKKNPVSPELSSRHTRWDIAYLSVSNSEMCPKSFIPHPEQNSTFSSHPASSGFLREVEDESRLKPGSTAMSCHYFTHCLEKETTFGTISKRNNTDTRKHQPWWMWNGECEPKL